MILQQFCLLSLASPFLNFLSLLLLRHVLSLVAIPLIAVAWGHPMSTYTLAQFGVLLHSKTILYKTGSCWQRCHAQPDVPFLDFLMNSGFVLPFPFEVTKQDGREVWTCVNGQDRLRTLTLFLDGAIPCNCCAYCFLCTCWSSSHRLRPSPSLELVVWWATSHGQVLTSRACCILARCTGQSICGSFCMEWCVPYHASCCFWPCLLPEPLVFTYCQQVVQCPFLDFSIQRHSLLNLCRFLLFSNC